MAATESMDSAVGAAEIWASLDSDAGRSLLDTLGHDPGLREISLARRSHDADMVAVGVECARARMKARAKLGRPWASCFADVSGVEMASGPATAAHKACRLADAGLPVLDFCAGIGADARAIREAGCETLAVELSAARAWMCERNSGVRTSVEDATRFEIGDRAVHLDPQRRAGSRRSWSLDDLDPGMAFIERLSGAGVPACIKLGPGVDPASLPPGEVEVVSEGGRLTQALLWTGALAKMGLRASLLGERTESVVAGEVGDRHRTEAETAGGIGGFVFEPDPSLERVGLLGVVAEREGLGEIAPGLGLLTGDAPVDSAWLARFRVHESMAFHEKRAREWLSANDAGIVEVKTRGGSADADRLQRSLRCGGSVVYSVFVLRIGVGRDAPLRCVITTREAGAPG